MTCAWTVDGRMSCSICSLKAMVSPLGTPILNEFDCALLSLSHTIFTMNSMGIKKAVSVVHNCTDTCRFIDMDCPRHVERQDVTIKRLEYKHDFSGNLMFCLNVYCMKTYCLLFVCLFVFCAIQDTKKFPLSYSSYLMRKLMQKVTNASMYNNTRARMITCVIEWLHDSITLQQSSA